MGLSSNTGFFNRAAEIYGTDTGAVITAKPRQKYNFSIFMTTVGGSFQFEKVSGVALPDYQYNVTRLNQYNHQRFVTTRQEITPATITFYDTVDNQFQNLLTSYASYYYTQGLSDLNPSQIINNATNPSVNSPMGLKAVPANNRFFFTNITVRNEDSGPNTGRAIDMVNCMITNVSHDRLDYSDSQPVLFTATFQPEHVNFLTSDATGSTDAVGAAQSINTSELSNSVTNSTAQNSTTQGSNIVVDSNGNPVIDSNGNPVTFG